MTEEEVEEQVRQTVEVIKALDSIFEGKLSSAVIAAICFHLGQFYRCQLRYKFDMDTFLAFVDGKVRAAAVIEQETPRLHS